MKPRQRSLSKKSLLVGMRPSAKVMYNFERLPSFTLLNRCISTNLTNSGQDQSPGNQKSVRQATETSIQQVNSVVRFQECGETSSISVGAASRPPNKSSQLIQTLSRYNSASSGIFDPDLACSVQVLRSHNKGVPDEATKQLRTKIKRGLGTTLE